MEVDINKNYDVEIIPRIIANRILSNYTYEELSTITGIPESKIEEVEKSPFHSYTEEIVKLCHFLNVPIKDTAEI